MIAAPPDLLVIGGLTVDRFADGSSVPGGSVLHIARAAAPRGIRVAIITVAGPEPEAQAGLVELARLAFTVEHAAAEGTATFTHRTAEGGRLLSIERRGGRVHIAGSRLIGGAPAVLVASVAGEVVGEDLWRLQSFPFRAAILQGWLRSATGGEVRPLALASLEPGVTATLRGFDLLVASREDLLGEAPDPAQQLTALRCQFGERPELVVTDGRQGLWTEDGHLPVPRLVVGVPDVGAGDVLAAFLAVPAEGPALGLEDRARAAMAIVASVLEQRRA